ncbi:thiol-disulfide oxidoreductase DCC family protein [Pedobacter sp. NJ-S-72]
MQYSIIFFDGVCNLCTGSVKFVIKRDLKDQFRFAALQSDVAQQYLGPFGLSLSELSSIILFENGRVYQRSTAALRITRHLSGAWPLLYGLLIVPALPLSGTSYMIRSQSADIRSGGGRRAVWYLPLY